MLSAKPSTPKPDRHLSTFGAMLAVPGMMADGITPALQISTIEHPDLQIGWQRQRRRQVEELGIEASRRMARGAPPEERMRQLCTFMFEEQGFAGNEENFGDPRNSCLCDVLDRKLGIPISLAVLTMAIGREAGLRIDGIGAPGHFLCAIDSGEGDRLFVDPFNRGAFLTRESARERVRGIVGEIDDAVCDHLLRPAGTADILARMLHNLKNTYAERGNARRLLASLDWLLLVQPANLLEIRNRGLVLLRLGQFQRAVQDLAFYIQSAPNADDSEFIRAEIERALALQALNN